MDFADTFEGADATPTRARGRKTAEEPEEESSQLRLERTVLGTLTRLSPEDAAVFLTELGPEDFTAPRHVAALEAIGALHERGELATPSALASELEQRKAPQAYRATLFLDSLGAVAETLEALPDHVSRLREAGAKRRATAALSTSVGLARQGLPAETVAAGILEVAEGIAASGRWPEPVPIEMPLPAAFPRDVLQGDFWRMCETISAAFQVPIDMPVMLGLGAVSACVAGKVAVRARPGWTEPVNLFVVCAQPPASRKSPVVKAMTYPIADFEQRERERLGPETEETQSALRVAESSLRRAEDALSRAKADDREKADAWRQRCVQDLATARGALVRSPRIVTDDATPEALTSLLTEHDGRMAVISAEGGGLFDMMAGKYSKTPNLDVYLKGHAGDTIRVDRKGRAPEYVRSPALTVAIATQPDTFGVLASRPELRGRGLPARFLYSCPASNVGFRDTDPPPPDGPTVRAWGDLLRVLLRITPGFDDEGCSRPRLITLDAEAAAELVRLERDTEPRLRSSADLANIPDWGGKLVGAAVRLAGLLHVLRHPEEPWETPMEGDTMQRSGFLLEEYFTPHARVVFKVMGESQAVPGARKLLDWLRRHRRAVFTTRDALRSIDRNGDRKTVVDPVLAVLLAHGWIREADREEKKPGRPSERYHVHPHLLRSA